jgi:cytochrome P450
MMADSMTAIVNQLIDEFIDAGEVELASAFSQPLPLRVIARELGVPATDLEKFKRWSQAFVDQLSQMAGPEGEVRAAREIVAFQHYFAERLEERRHAPRDDILSDLATVTLTEEGDPRGLTTREALSIIQQLLVAGNETSAHTISEGMKLLIENPEQMQAVIADPGLIPGLVEETLRVLSPTQNMWRVAARDTELAGVAIPAGSVLLLSYVRRHVAFGYGIHVCLGAAMARREIAIAFGLLLSRIRGWRFTPGRNDFLHPPNILLQGLAELHLSFDPPSRLV